MQIPLLITLSILLVLADPATVVDLSRSAQEFPTKQVTVTGCNAAYDSGTREPPAWCSPFPVTIEIDGVKPSPAGDGTFVLAVRVTNRSAHTIQLPRSTGPTTGHGKQTFISLSVFSPPGSLNIVTMSYAFTDQETPSSVAHIGANGSIVYDLPFDKHKVQQSPTSAGTEKDDRQIAVQLNAFSLERDPKTSQEVSVQKGNPIISKPFSLPN